MKKKIFSEVKHFRLTKENAARLETAALRFGKGIPQNKMINIILEEYFQIENNIIYSIKKDIEDLKREVKK